MSISSPKEALYSARRARAKERRIQGALQEKLAPMLLPATVEPAPRSVPAADLDHRQFATPVHAQLYGLRKEWWRRMRRVSRTAAPHEEWVELARWMRDLLKDIRAARVRLQEQIMIFAWEQRSSNGASDAAQLDALRVLATFQGELVQARRMLPSLLRERRAAAQNPDRAKLARQSAQDTQAQNRERERELVRTGQIAEALLIAQAARRVLPPEWRARVMGELPKERRAKKLGDWPDVAGLVRENRELKFALRQMLEGSVPVLGLTDASAVDERAKVLAAYSQQVSEVQMDLSLPGRPLGRLANSPDGGS